MDEHDAAKLLLQATTQYQRGRTQEALRQLDDLVRLIPDEDSLLRTEILLQKASWLRETGHPEEASSILTQVEVAMSQGDRSGWEGTWAILRQGQGVIASRRGDFAAAESLLAEAEAFARASDDRELTLPDVLANMASLFLDTGRVNAAQDALYEALRIDEELRNDRNVANDLNMLGITYWQLGDRKMARAYFTRSRDVARQGRLAKEELDASSNLDALALADSGGHQQAENRFSVASDAYREMGFETGHSTANAGVVALRAGDLDSARRLLERAHELHVAAGDWIHSLYDQLNLSQVERDSGDLDQATRTAVAVLEDARRRGLVGLLWAIEYLVAKYKFEASTGTDRHPDLTKGLRTEALEGLRRSAESIELLRAGIDRPEEREWLLVDKEQVYVLAVLLCVALAQGKEAFRFGERARARALIEALGRDRLSHLDHRTVAGGRRQELVNRVLDHGRPASEKERLLDELRMLRAEVVAHEPAVAAISETQLPSEEEIAAAVPAGTMLIEYFRAGRTLLIFALDNSGLRECALATLNEIELDDAVRNLRREIEQGETHPPTGEILCAMLINPVTPLLGGVQEVIFVPHGPLHYVPFTALWYRPVGDNAPPRRYLKNRFFMTTVPAAGVLPMMSAARAETGWAYGPPLVFGDPTGDLPGAAREARRVAEALGVLPRLGRDATAGAFLGAESPSVVHVACHGTYNEDDPLLSGLRFADGMVTVEDILARGPRTKLLVLSGCLPGRSERRPGDELVGLSRAALMRGTASVVAALWETSDESSALFFSYFYEALRGGAQVSQAMGYGQEMVSANHAEDGRPIDWAPFVLLGDWRTTLT